MSQDLVFWCRRGLTLGGLVVIIQTVYIVMLYLTLKLFSIQVKTMKLFN